jgi:polyisoprenoid-binding protein YceI
MTMSIECWEIDRPGTRIHFAVRHLVFSKTRGRFSRVRGTVMVLPRITFTARRVVAEPARFSAVTAIDRRDFGFTGNLALDIGGVVIGERLDVEIEVEAVRQPAVRAA